MKGLHGIKNYCMKQWKKDKKIILCAFAAGLFTTVFCAYGAAGAYSEEIQTGIASKVIRFHILANSDREEDQKLKLAVRNRVLTDMKPFLEQCKNKEETKKILEASFERIRQSALEEIRRQGYGYDVKVSLCQDVFPLKQYGKLTFPPGTYDALRIEIGRAEGYNWWCVMFPPMCFVDAACDDGEIAESSKRNLAGALTEEEYTVIAAMENQELTPKIKLKIVEWYQELKSK